ncbi:MAG: sodium:proton antiporter [Chlorobi bacterium]|nr:sodium:proton antiporter [Chlorobiota bacterium]
MIVSLAGLVIAGMLIAWLFKFLKVPELVGILILGIALGPFALNMLDPSLINIAGQLTSAALIVILLRAGFELSKDTLKKVGRPAILLSMVPAAFEATAIMFLAHYFLNFTLLEGAILGSVLGAVSPAVVVPLMIKFIDEKRGTKKGIPTLVLAGSSIDDVFVIVIYSILIGIYTGGHVNVAWELFSIPISIILGIVVGLIVGLVLYILFDKFNPRATKRMLIILAISVFLVQAEHLLDNIIPFASLLAVMAIGFIILEKRGKYAHELSEKLSKLWILAEIVLFTMVGSEVNIHLALKMGLIGALIIFIALIFRSIGTWVSLIGTNFTRKEKLFIIISYIPKATVQAAIGGAPLAAMQASGMTTLPGEQILAMAVLSILLTAPLGAWGITVYGKKVLEVDTELTVHTKQEISENNK